MCIQTQTHTHAVETVSMVQASGAAGVVEGGGVEGTAAAAGVRRRHVNHCYPVNNKERASPKMLRSVAIITPHRYQYDSGRGVMRRRK